MAKQTINQGTAPTGVGGDTFRSGSAKLQANDDEIYAALGASDGVLPAALPVDKGGTGATTIVAAKANLGLDKFAQNPGLNTAMGAPSADSAIIVSDTGWGIYKGNAPYFSRALKITDGGTGAETAEQARVNLGLDCFFQQGGFNTFVMSPNKNLYINLVNDDVSLYKVSTNTSYAIRTGLNTTVDGNGFIKTASPIVQLFADRIELNDEAQQQEITFEKLGVGDYLIKGSSGFAQEGWYVEQPKDANGNTYHAVEYGTHTNGNIWLKTYEQVMDGTRIVADHTKPIDIKENRFISIRLNELPKDDTSPLNPTIIDDEGNAAPSKYHTLENGVWVISEVDSEKLEEDKYKAYMDSLKPLTRRQFMRVLVLNGFDLDVIETHIQAIEDTKTRQLALIDWKEATEFRRNDETLLMVAGLVGLSEEQVNVMWEQGMGV